MSTIILFLAVIACIAGWWLSRQRLMAKPWLEEGVIGEVAGTSASPLPAVKIGLGVFLTVVGSLFALLISAYSMRRQAADWQALPVPDLLWFNTMILIASSVALHWTRRAARGGRVDDVKIGLFTAAATALMFLVGQLLVWRQLTNAGYFMATNPANAFFFLIVALHGLHLAGGLAALGRTTTRIWQRESADRMRLSIDLCATYWHFLLLVWLVLLAMLTRWVGDFVALCGQYLT
ncbi:MAG: cytochrome c oxidase subunit 3 [Dongiaceae bacterium]